jgi:hypothetical protein
VGTDPSLLTRAVTTALSSASASFNSTVRWTLLSHRCVGI